MGGNTMQRAIIIYGSTTGNTELLAGYIGDGVKEAGLDVTIRNVINVSVEDMLGYDVIFLGSSTWGEGDLQDDFVPFYEAMDGFSLSGKKAAAFGPGDGSYDLFCEAVDMLEDRLRDCGVAIIAPGLKIDGDVVAAEKAAAEWGKQAATALKA
jgi:flavodoxin I